MPVYRVRFLVEFVAESDQQTETVAEITQEIQNVYEVTSVAYGDLEVTDPDVDPEEDEDDE